MIARLLVLTVFAHVPAIMAQSPANCLWFTTGSAAKILGADVTVTAQSDGNWEGSCRFVRQSGTTTQAIEIMVSKTNPHACPEGGAKLKALGNEAMQCRQTMPGEVEDMIAGRMRDAYFTVTIINVPAAARPPARPEDHDDSSALERIAEQVVGNLY